MRSLLALLVLAASGSAADHFDVVVYGGTAGGVIAAVSAARAGMKVALLEPGRHIGGMASGGLSATDVGRKEVIGGNALEFYLRAGRHYDMAQYGQEAAWRMEPHVAEEIFRQMLREAGVTVMMEHRLREKDGVTKAGATLRQITVESGASFNASVFVDSSYEGDLMAQAGVSYTWGREGTSQYGESLAGVRAMTEGHQFEVNLSPYDAKGNLLPEIDRAPRGEPGAADRKVQAYNYRLYFSDDPANQTPFARPARYDPARYELLARLLKARLQATLIGADLTKATMVAATFEKADLTDCRVYGDSTWDVNLSDAISEEPDYQAGVRSSSSSRSSRHPPSSYISS